MSQEPQVGTAQTGQPELAEQPTSPAVVRAEHLMDEWGQHIGFFFGLTRQRLQNVATALRNEVGQMNNSSHAASNSSSQVAAQQSSTVQEAGTGDGVMGQLATQRSEQLVDAFALQVVALTSATSLQIRRTGAFIREDAEDMWAEAQNLRNQGKQFSPQISRKRRL
ncbi:MAG: hypothetical protein NVSMB49_21220 [Ktedonobacteraceae bacterium]